MTTSNRILTSEGMGPREDIGTSRATRHEMRDVGGASMKLQFCGALASVSRQFSINSTSRLGTDFEYNFIVSVGPVWPEGARPRALGA